MDGFEEFWSAYPRKEAKKDAQKAWMHMTPEQQFTARESIADHARYWEVVGRTKQYIPLAATWLRGERWSDELGIPQPRALDEWWKTTAGIKAKAQAVGVEARSGEDWHSLKARILAKERAA